MPIFWSGLLFTTYHSLSWTWRRFRRLSPRRRALCSPWRNRFNLLGCVDPFSLDIIQSHSMVYVDAEQTKAFLQKVRLASGDTPVSIVLDNARYQHCQAVKDKAAELGINLLFLPPYSSNLNIIERLWKYTRRHVLAGKYFDSPTKFHETLRFFFWGWLYQS